MGFKESIVKFGMKVFMGAKKYSPEIAIVGGLVGVGAGVFLACKATLKLDELLDNEEAEFERINNAIDDQTLPEYTEEVAQEDVKKVKMNTAIDIVKAYIPAAGVLVTGVTLILLSHKILRDRNTALMGAYSALATAFAAYRKRVVDYDGKEQDLKYLYGNRTPKMVEETVVHDDGTSEVVLVEKGKEDIYLLGSPYARIFDSDHSTMAYSIDTDPHNDLNFTLLRQSQTMFNNKLHSYGFVFLNDVLEHLGFEKVPEGQLVGWRLIGNGDGYIDFGINNCYENPDCKDLVEKDGFTRKLVLDFNVDGIIYDKIGTGRPNELTDDELWALQNK